MAYIRRNLERGRPAGLIRLRIEYEGEVGDWFELLLAAPQEMATLGMRSGWRLREGYYAEGRDAMYTAVMEKEGPSEVEEGAHWEQRSLEDAR